MNKTKYALYNTHSHTIYYKGSSYFDFDPSTSDLYERSDKMYDDLKQARSAMYRLRKEDRPFWRVLCPTELKDCWKIVAVTFSCSTMEI